MQAKAETSEPWPWPKQKSFQTITIGFPDASLPESERAVFTAGGVQFTVWRKPVK